MQYRIAIRLAIADFGPSRFARWSGSHVSAHSRGNLRPVPQETRLRWAFCLFEVRRIGVRMGRVASVCRRCSSPQLLIAISRLVGFAIASRTRSGLSIPHQSDTSLRIRQTSTPISIMPKNLAMVALPLPGTNPTMIPVVLVYMRQRLITLIMEQATNSRRWPAFETPSPPAPAAGLAPYPAGASVQSPPSATIRKLIQRSLFSNAAIRRRPETVFRLLDTMTKEFGTADLPQQAIPRTRSPSPQGIPCLEIP